MNKACQQIDIEGGTHCCQPPRNALTLAAGTVDARCNRLKRAAKDLVQSLENELEVVGRVRDGLGGHRRVGGVGSVGVGQFWN